MKACWKCGNAWKELGQPGVRDYCEKCDTYWHSCKNCKYHDPNAHNQCKIPGTEMVADRERANHCDEFELADRQAGVREALKQPNKLNALLGDDDNDKPQIRL